MIACMHPLDITYTIADDGRSITFRPCGFTSHNRHDVEHRYCPACHRYMDLIEMAKDVTKKYSLDED